VFDEDQLRQMSHGERHRLMRALAAIENADPGPDQVSTRRRAIVLAVIVVCCVVLAVWIGVLAVTLPRYYRSGGWRGAWVGFDLALLTAFAVTGWAAWRRRQVLIICLVVLATLLCCDAWFDVLLDARTQGFVLSLLTAVFIELPLAGLAILGARRLLRLSISVVRRYEGDPEPQRRLRQAAIIGGSPGSHLSDLFNEPGGKAGPRRRAGPGSASAPGASDHDGDELTPGEELLDYGAGYRDAGYGGPDYGRPHDEDRGHASPDGAGPEHPVPADGGGGFPVPGSGVPAAGLQPGRARAELPAQDA
jgi:hypothetical protein